jgi:two-component system, OmpR family, sensor histidine kinase QseC
LKKIKIQKNYSLPPTPYSPLPTPYSQLPTPYSPLNMNPALTDVLISNLISNAIKHNIQDGSINIELNDKIVKITNTGEKLDEPPDELFSRFKKAKVDSDSLGLGLSIVKKITELYKMNISYTYSNNMHTITIEF